MKRPFQTLLKCCGLLLGTSALAISGSLLALECGNIHAAGTDIKVLSEDLQHGFTADSRFRPLMHSDALVLIGDGQHGDRRITGYLASDHFLSMAESAGRKYLCLEGETEYQPHVDDLIHGRISRNEFVDIMSNHGTKAMESGADPTDTYAGMADIVIGASRHGMTTLLVEPKSNEYALMEAEFSTRFVRGWIKQQQERDPSQPHNESKEYMAYTNSHPDEEQDYLDKIVKLRISPECNKSILDNALAMVAERQHQPAQPSDIVMVYGRGHIPVLGYVAAQAGIETGAVIIEPSDQMAAHAAVFSQPPAIQQFARNPVYSVADKHWQRP